MILIEAQVLSRERDKVVAYRHTIDEQKVNQDTPLGLELKHRAAHSGKYRSDKKLM